MSDETKICPYCGEEVLAIAKKCKHCEEWLENHPSNSLENNLIDTLDVNDDWKERFKLIEKYYIDGCITKVKTEEFQKGGKHQVVADHKKIRTIPTLLLAWLFTLFYYLLKGMWLKALVYVLIAILIGAIWGDSYLAIMLGALSAGLFGAMAPFSFYRLKVLGKQW